MEVDLGNALDSVATPGVPLSALERLDERVAIAHERIEAGRNARALGYAALALPETVDPDAIRETVEPLVDAECVLVVGIGGSALGAATILDALESDTDAYVLDNVDPAHVSRVLDRLPLVDTAVHVVSRSGTTAETLANFLAVRDAFATDGVDWTERTLVTTGPEGPLRRLADRHDLPVLDAPENVPGRFSVLSTVGLPVAAICGHDVDALLAGAGEGADGLSGSLFECPGYAYGAVAYALSIRSASVNAMMPYAESLETFAEWFAQLWAESLGKDGLGQVPARALGATDQHSQLQLYRAGPRNTMVTMLRPRERPALELSQPEADELSYLGGRDIAELLEAEFEATEASLAAARRPNVRIEIDAVDERSLGELFYGMEAACVLTGELFDVETFTQPAVEWGKKAARGLLGADRTIEAERVREKETLRVR